MSDIIYSKPTLLINGTPFHLASQGLISQGELAKLRREMEKANETKNRVDISLKEYEELKRVNKDLLDRLNHAEGILGMIGIPADMIQNINRDSVKWYSAEDINFALCTRKFRYRIEFDVEE